MTESGTEPSRAVAVIGMHRSGTSVIARGLAALGVYLGNNFLDAQPENPTGYWEDRGIVELNDRVLKTLGLTWESLVPIERSAFRGWRMWRLRRAIAQYLRRYFLRRPLWGFKDPRTIRLLPIWRHVLAQCNAADSYLLVIRNPSSVAASLYARQMMDLQTAQRLWLVNVVPFLREIEGKCLAVVDYDLLMANPPDQLERIARKLALGAADSMVQIERFGGEFLDAGLRHTVFSADDIDARSDAGRLTREAFVLLYELAADRRDPDAAFWRAWADVEASFARL